MGRIIHSAVLSLLTLLILLLLFAAAVPSGQIGDEVRERWLQEDAGGEYDFL